MWWGSFLAPAQQIVYHEGMTEDGLCENGDGKPVHGAQDLCQACYRRARRLARGLKKPGPKPDPAKPFSRHNNETSHHNRRIKCKYLHYFDGVDANGKQTCSTCDESRRTAPCPAGHSYTFKNDRGACRECARLAVRLRRWDDKYGLTREMLEQMLEDQDYTCALCPAVFNFDDVKPFCVDHDHDCCRGQKTCGKCIRKLLCDDCNKRVREDADWHLRAAEYIEFHKKLQEEK